MGVDDNTMLRPRPRSTLLDMKPVVARGPDTADMPADIPAIDELVPLPQAGDPYKAYSRPDNKALLMLRFLRRDSSVEGFSYADLRRTSTLPAADAGGGPSLVLRFVEAVITEVVIQGRHLEMLANLLAYHRVSWLRELPPGTMQQDKNAAVITAIRIKEIDN